MLFTIVIFGGILLLLRCYHCFSFSLTRVTCYLCNSKVSCDFNCQKNKILYFGFQMRYLRGEGVGRLKVLIFINCLSLYALTMYVKWKSTKSIWCYFNLSSNSFVLHCHCYFFRYTIQKILYCLMFTDFFLPIIYEANCLVKQTVCSLWIFVLQIFRPSWVSGKHRKQCMKM